MRDYTELQKRVYHTFLKNGWITADEAATYLGLSVLAVRPRVTELKNQGKLVLTGLRRRNASGIYARVLRAA